MVVLADIGQFSAWSLGFYLCDTVLWLCSPGSECLMAPPPYLLFSILWALGLLWGLILTLGNFLR